MIRCAIYGRIISSAVTATPSRRSPLVRQTLQSLRIYVHRPINRRNISSRAISRSHPLPGLLLLLSMCAMCEIVHERSDHCSMRGSAVASPLSAVLCVGCQTNTAVNTVMRGTNKLRHTRVSGLPLGPPILPASHTRPPTLSAVAAADCRRGSGNTRGRASAQMRVNDLSVIETVKAMCEADKCVCMCVHLKRLFRIGTYLPCRG